MAARDRTNVNAAITQLVKVLPSFTHVFVRCHLDCFILGLVASATMFSGAIGSTSAACCWAWSLLRWYLPLTMTVLLASGLVGRLNPSRLPLSGELPAVLRRAGDFLNNLFAKVVIA